MKITELLTKNRSYRRFDEDHAIEEQTLIDLVALTRLCPSSGNRQPLRYLVSCAPEMNEKVFPHLRWAAALKDWPGPGPGERPTGYIVVLGDADMPGSLNVDSGIVAQSMLLAAAEQGLGGCMIGSIDRDRLHEALKIPGDYIIVLVVGLGKPKETVVLEDVDASGNVAYWRDEQGVHHVPKRTMDQLLVSF